MHITRSQWMLGSCVTLSIVIFFALLLHPSESVKNAITGAAVAFTGFSLFMTAYSVSETHRSNRYSYTLRMMEEWNNQIRSHLDAIDAAFPDFRRVPDDKSVWKIPTDRAEQILAAGNTPGSPDASLRNSLITTLNFFEAMARGYELSSVERETVRESFGPMVLDVWHFFLPFIDKMRADRKREPWPPLLRVCEVWDADDMRQKKAADAVDATAKYKEKQRNARQVRPTGG